MSTFGLPSQCQHPFLYIFHNAHQQHLWSRCPRYGIYYV
jgi:hypothetical protein